MASPIAGVFDTYELLEKILLSLSTKNLFGVQRVSQTWKSLIEQSHALQKRMYLLADGEPLRPSHTGGPASSMNPYPGRVRLNPVADYVFGSPSHKTTSSRGEGWIRFSMHEPSKYTNSDFSCVLVTLYDEHPMNPTYLAQNATCNNMFITQPPVVAMRLNLRFNFCCTIYDPDGITFKSAWEGRARVCQNYDKYSTGRLAFRAREGLSFTMSLPLEDEARKTAYEQCAYPEKESCSCIPALFGPEPYRHL